ncbi:MAG: hypothetical protein ETSY2_36380 [Candidatus Entotheonella gemina]|uniref:Uncharacterized protein n=1 Tax=Candidatus Entotheonella gemina TaxID=1429439 RepID=W4LW23_9BACT|nr:MAG: hypothetical protein ETSY2_36380 [Candidatus Entotheonella gemina]
MPLLFSRRGTFAAEANLYRHRQNTCSTHLSTFAIITPNLSLTLGTASVGD